VTHLDPPEDVDQPSKIENFISNVIVDKMRLSAMYESKKNIDVNINKYLTEDVDIEDELAPEKQEKNEHKDQRHFKHDINKVNLFKKMKKDLNLCMSIPTYYYSMILVSF